MDRFFGEVLHRKHNNFQYLLACDNYNASLGAIVCAVGVLYFDICEGKVTFM